MQHNSFKQWQKPSGEMKSRVFSIAHSSTAFKRYYDDIQEFLKVMAGFDELLPASCTQLLSLQIQYDLHF